MRKQLRIAVKEYCRKEFLNTREKMNISQEEMAHNLFMSTRAYVSLEGGKSCCSLITLIFFLQRCPVDPADFILGIINSINDSFFDAA